MSATPLSPNVFIREYPEFPPFVPVPPIIGGGPSLPVITSPDTSSFAWGVPFSYQITADNDPTNFGAYHLPSGLSINTLTGLISGVVKQSTFSILIVATNEAGSTIQTVLVEEEYGLTSVTTGQGLSAENYLAGFFGSHSVSVNQGVSAVSVASGSSTFSRLGAATYRTFPAPVPFVPDETTRYGLNLLRPFTYGIGHLAGFNLLRPFTYGIGHLAIAANIKRVTVN